jgi:hypothetical protein
MEEPISERAAQFLAWLKDGVPVEAGARKYWVFSRGEAKERLKELISEERYIEAKEFARALSQTYLPSGKYVTKSFRVSFPSYLWLVKRASETRTTFTELIRDFVVAELGQILEHLNAKSTSESSQYPIEKLREVEDTLKEWRSQDVKDRAQTLRLQMPYFPEMSLKLWEACIEEIVESTLKTGYEAGLEKETRLLLSQTRILDEVSIRCLHESYPEHIQGDLVRTNSDISLEYNFRFMAWGRLNKDHRAIVAQAELSEDLGQDKLTRLLNVLDLSFGEEDPSWFKLNLLSGKVELLESREVRFNGMQIPSKRDRKGWESFTSKILGVVGNETEKVKELLDVALSQEEYEEVQELTNSLAVLTRREKIIRYGIDSLRLLMGSRSQVVSFNLPEIVLAAWEAFGTGSLEALIERREIGEEN